MDINEEKYKKKKKFLGETKESVCAIEQQYNTEYKGAEQLE